MFVPRFDARLITRTVANTSNSCEFIRKRSDSRLSREGCVGSVETHDWSIERHRERFRTNDAHNHHAIILRPPK